MGLPSNQDFFFGTFLPFFLALERPMAIACFWLLTLPPRPPLPVFASLFLYRRISFLTERPVPREYFLRLLAM